MPDISFKYSPNEYVLVSLFGLGHEGRIQRCIYDGQSLYDIEFCNEGKLDRREFAEDELSAHGSRKPQPGRTGFMDAGDILDFSAMKANSEAIEKAVAKGLEGGSAFRGKVRGLDA